MDINPATKMGALEVADEIVEAIEAAGGAGISVKDGALLTGMHYTEFYETAKRLADMGKIKIVRREQQRVRLVGLDGEDAWVYPLSDWPQKVLAFLCNQADENGLARASLKQIARAVGHQSTPSASIDALDRKGFLEIRDRGGWDRPRLYEVFKNGDGPKGWSALWYSPKIGPPRPTFNVLSEYIRSLDEGERR